MANIKQQKKRIITSEKARVRNISYKSKLRSAAKAVRVHQEAFTVYTCIKCLQNSTYFYSIIITSIILGGITRVSIKSYTFVCDHKTNRFRTIFISIFVRIFLIN